MSFCLIPATDMLFEKEKPLRALRVGLNSEKDPIMHGKYYRFFVMPTQKHADKTGIAEALRNQGIDETEIKNIWG